MPLNARKTKQNTDVLHHWGEAGCAGLTGEYNVSHIWRYTSGKAWCHRTLSGNFKGQNYKKYPIKSGRQTEPHL